MYKFRFARLFLSAVIFLIFAGCLPASAIEIIIKNELDGTASVSLHYFNRGRGVWVTKGWYNVDSGGERTFSLNNVDLDSPFYYHAYVRNEYYMDSSSAGSDVVEKWVQKEAHEIHNDNRPSGTSVRKVPFYESAYSQGVGGYAINLDTIPNG